MSCWKQTATLPLSLATSARAAAGPSPAEAPPTAMRLWSTPRASALSANYFSPV